ncbi:MAG: hypothetical protein JWQ49_3070 [Edaphobacter sp.]|nr:hypothetical protein [Edaphobacter sp.]
MRKRLIPALVLTIGNIGSHMDLSSGEAGHQAPFQRAAARLPDWADYSEPCPTELAYYKTRYQVSTQVHESCLGLTRDGGKSPTPFARSTLRCHLDSEAGRQVADPLPHRPPHDKQQRRNARQYLILRPSSFWARSLE